MICIYDVQMILIIIDMNKNVLQGIVQKYFCHKYQEKVKKKLIEK